MNLTKKVNNINKCLNGRFSFKWLIFGKHTHIFIDNSMRCKSWICPNCKKIESVMVMTQDEYHCLFINLWPIVAEEDQEGAILCLNCGEIFYFPYKEILEKLIRQYYLKKISRDEFYEKLLLNEK